MGKYAAIYTYRYANQLPLTGEADALTVNWCEVTITREDTGEQLYQNASVTDFDVGDTSVEAIVRDGRARWKVENENNNALKTKGYISSTTSGMVASTWPRSYSPSTCWRFYSTPF